MVVRTDVDELPELSEAMQSIRIAMLGLLQYISCESSGA
jgi:hypothetical protein